MAFGWEDLARLLAACIAGAAIGLERELSDKPAGLRTNVMICLGAAVFTLLSSRLGVGDRTSDPARVAAQVVTGVGFLGAGAILHARGNVIGLTTAATIWIVASVGMAFGSGAFVLGAVATVLTAGVLFGLAVVEARIAAWRTTAKFLIEMKPEPEVRQVVKRRVRELGLQRREWRVSKTPDGFTGFLEVTGPESRLDRLYKTIMAEEGVESLERL
ncbi:MAG: MgtC/SapB family protein [Phycisphaerae bacterium]|jgi:putative Mg2+ transporter-C (MgtC) family protein